MPVRTRGVAQLKRLAAGHDGGPESSERHVHQFRIALLELEKTRRMHARQAALARLRELEDRLIEIEALIQTHQDALRGAAASSAPPVERNAPVSEKRRTLRY